MLPMQAEALSYILRLVCIIKPLLTSQYLLTITGVLINNKVVHYILPKHAVVMDGTLQDILVSSCTTWSMNNFQYSAELQSRDIHCINKSANCLYKSKTFNEIFLNYNCLGYSIVSNLTNKISNACIISKIISVNGFQYVLFNICGFVYFGEHLMLPLTNRDFIYEINYEIKKTNLTRKFNRLFR